MIIIHQTSVIVTYIATASLTKLRHVCVWGQGMRVLCAVCMLCVLPLLHSQVCHSLLLACSHVSGYNHSTLLINNNGRGPAKTQGKIPDYTDLSKDWGHAWFLPQHGQHDFAGRLCSRCVCLTFMRHDGCQIAAPLDAW